MKRALILLLSALTATILFGCQPEKEEVDAEEVKSETASEKMEGLLGEGDISQVELFEVKGINPVVYDETNELEVFRDLFSSADKEPGTVNMSDPEFYLKIIMEDGGRRYLNLWLGGEEDRASLMDIEDSNTIYMMTPDAKRKVIELMGD